MQQYITQLITNQDILSKVIYWRKQMYSFISLKVNCPHCNESLMDTSELIDDIPSIKLKISSKDADGLIHLSSFYGSYKYSTDIEIKKGTAYKFGCPHCEKKITSKIKCTECSAKLIPLSFFRPDINFYCSSELKLGIISLWI